MEPWNLAIRREDEVLRDTAVTWKLEGGRNDMRVTIVLSYECTACSGHGSPCGRCNQGRIEETHTPSSLHKRLGDGLYRSVCSILGDAFNEGATP